ncbi:hypothetical protein GCM10020254_02370 [Streptomyces goshikiensis]
MSQSSGGTSDRIRAWIAARADSGGVLTGEDADHDLRAGVFGESVAQRRREVGPLGELAAHLLVRVLGQPPGRVGIQRAVAHRPGARDRVRQQSREQVGRRYGMGKPCVVLRAGARSHGVFRIRQQEPSHRFGGPRPPPRERRPYLRVRVGRQPGAQVRGYVSALRQGHPHL